MIEQIDNYIEDIKSIKTRLPELRDYFWFKIDRYNEFDRQRGEIFDEKFEKQSANLCRVIESFVSFVEKSFAPSPQEIAKMEAALNAIEFVSDEETKKVVWKSIMGNIPMISKKEIETIKPKKQLSERVWKQPHTINVIELNSSITHFIDEDFTSKQPCEFSIIKNKYTVKSFKDIYIQTLKFVHSIEDDLFFKTAARIHGKNGPYFSKDKRELRKAYLILPEYYAEVNCNANRFMKNIRYFLDAFNIPHSEMKIYISKDRNA
jgi:hypothetical protein